MGRRQGGAERVFQDGSGVDEVSRKWKRREITGKLERKVRGGGWVKLACTENPGTQPHTAKMSMTHPPPTIQRGKGENEEQRFTVLGIQAADGQGVGLRQGSGNNRMVVVKKRVGLLTSDVWER